jgi:hypothetical protein
MPQVELLVRVVILATMLLAASSLCPALLRRRQNPRSLRRKRLPVSLTRILHNNESNVPSVADLVMTIVKWAATGGCAAATAERMGREGRDTGQEWRRRRDRDRCWRDGRKSTFVHIAPLLRNKGLQEALSHFATDHRPIFVRRARFLPIPEFGNALKAFPARRSKWLCDLGRRPTAWTCWWQCSRVARFRSSASASIHCELSAFSSYHCSVSAITSSARQARVLS